MTDPTVGFEAALEGLRRGDFTRLAPLFDSGGSSGRSKIVLWHEDGLFANHAAEAAEALTCACFLGERETAEYLLSKGLDPSGGLATGMSAIHCAASRGELGTLKLLLEHRASLEARNMYGGTALGQAVWSALNQPMRGQREAILELLAAGADVKQVEFPTGDDRIDDLLRQFGAT